VVLVPLHTTPKDVEKELNALYDVFLDVSQRWQSKVGPSSSHERDGDRWGQLGTTQPLDLTASLVLRK
jgi:hypothetical protein